MGGPKPFKPRHTRAYKARAHRNAALVCGSGPKRVKTGFVTTRRGTEYNIYRDLRPGCMYNRIRLDPVDPMYVDDPEYVVAQTEIIREGGRDEPAMFLILPSGVYKRHVVSATAADNFYILMDGKRVGVSKN